MVSQFVYRLAEHSVNQGGINQQTKPFSSRVWPIQFQNTFHDAKGLDSKFL